MSTGGRWSSECASFRLNQRLRRRDVLSLGSLCGLPLTMPQWVQAQQAATASGSSLRVRARQVIMLYLHGGHPQQETFDPKPDGPSAVRGEFGAISTSVPGVRFSELLPRTATWMHRMAVVRSMSHENANHVQACLPANTGHKHPVTVRSRGDFPPSATDFPPFGAVLDAIRPAPPTLPTWVRVGPLMRRSNGTVLHGQTPGLLGEKHSSFVVDQPLLKPDVKIDAIQPHDDLTRVRLVNRKNLLQQFDAHSRLIDEVAQAHQLGDHYQRAFSLLSSPQTRAAFDLASEPAAVRDRYGQTEFGQRCLLARRLAEAGVPMVNVSYCHTPSGSWDTHSKNGTKMRDALAPTLDAALTALLEDLDLRGRFDDTLVIVNAEFGRTPKINKNAGRDHWPWVYSLALAGAGIQAGTVYGASDESAAYPAENPHDPEDMAATLYHLMGIGADTRIVDRLNRPHQLVLGEPIQAILA